MKAGELRHRVILQKPTETTNDIEEVVYTWSDEATVWAAVEPNTGSWYFAAQQANSNVKGRVRMRYRSDIDPTWRLKFGDRILNIESILNPDEKNIETIVLYSEALD